jgi:hypothetical protein
MMMILIGTGLVQAFTGSLGTVTAVPGVHEHPAASGQLTGIAYAFLLLRVFSSGTTALTGVEAIANGITAFKAPKSRNAAATLVWDAALLMVMFLGLGVLGYLIGAQPSEQEVLISQVSRTIYGPGFMQILTLGSATVILIMAANTSFADFPRLAALQAGDGFLPRQFTFRGSRLVFSWGVIILAGFATLLLIVFAGSVSRLIPLYAIGVFLCFTLSQAGMARRWWHVGQKMKSGELKPGGEIPTHGSVLYYDEHWNWKMILNGFGAAITTVVAIIFLVTKFTSGAWLIVILIPTLVWVFDQIHKHYKHVAKTLSTEGQVASLARRPVETLILVSDVHRETLKLVEFANSLGVPWRAIHIGVNEERIADIQRKWKERVGIGELQIVKSPLRSITRPLRQFVEKEKRKTPNGYIHVVMGELRTSNPMSRLLHQNAHIIEQVALNDIEGVVTTIVPFNLELFEMEKQREQAGHKLKGTVPADAGEAQETTASESTSPVDSTEVHHE